MTIQHAVIAFPTLELAEQIESLRRRYDPLASVLSAHITLVFPFADDSLIEPHLERHVGQAVTDFAPFDFGFSAPSPDGDGYLFLNVTTGMEHFVRLHECLYSGALARYRSTTHLYRPHITIGRLGSSDQLMAAAAEACSLLDGPFVGRVEALAIFRLDQPLSGGVAATVPLDPNASLSSTRPAPNVR